jgi:hypothetical protein
VKGREAPADDQALNVLKLPLPSEEMAAPAPPTLEARQKPAETTPPQVDRVVWVPFTAVTDRHYSVAWKVEHSPFYRVERSVSYDLKIYEDNQTSVTQQKSSSVTVGVTTTETDAWNTEVGISVTYTTGVSFGVEAKASATLSAKLGFSSSTAVAELESVTVWRWLFIPAGTAAALWATLYELSVVRSDGTTVGKELALDVESFYSSQYPPVSEAQAAVQVLEAPLAEELQPA